MCIRPFVFMTVEEGRSATLIRPTSNNDVTIFYVGTSGFFRTR